MKNNDSIKIWVGEIEGGGYKLLDSGEGQKLEEVAGMKIVRAEPRAWWQWEVQSNQELAAQISVDQDKERLSFEEVIDIGVLDLKAKINFRTGSKHIGIFPEQISEWRWIHNKLESYKAQGKSKKEIKVLNLFGYTGIASLVAAKSGAKVTHIDASEGSVAWARENQKLSGLNDAPIRWIVDDVVKFLKKEIKRGEKYDAIIMDPPSYGKGPKGEVWKIEEQLPDLLLACREILSDQPLFIILNMYSTDLSSLSLINILNDITKDFDGSIEAGELAIKQENSERVLPMSIFALWCAN